MNGGGIMLRVVNKTPVWLGLVMLVLVGCAPATIDTYVRESVAAPDDPQRAYNAGTALLLDGDLALAEEVLARAAEQGKSARDALFNIGVARFELGDFRGAAAVYRQMLAVDPSDADARYNYELSLFYIENPLPESQEQLNEPQDGQTDPTMTPTPQPGGVDGPTPTPPREEFEPDPSQTPAGGSGDFADDAESTPVPRSSGGLTIEEAIELLNGIDSNQIAPFLLPTPVGGVNQENDW